MTESEGTGGASVTGPSESARTDRPSAVAGVGASSGGLGAIRDLLGALGAEPGLAVVILQHLDPSHPSSLVELLQRVTDLPVEFATDGTPVEANHVYIGPPAALTTITDGVLRVMPRPEPHAPSLSIDRFFESLALDRTVHPIGVVLTGTGSDGSQGVKAIKASGGTTFAQDDKAEFRGMPDSAIATGCVDFVMTPAAIARELVRLGKRDRGVALSPWTPDDAPDLHRILMAARQVSGIDFANYKQTTVRRRVRRRVVVNGLSNLQEYADLAQRNPDEARALSAEILIHVTSFFRDPETFDALRTVVFPQILKSRSSKDAPIRIWIPGCSTGEEVYSIAIALLEFLDDAGAPEIPVKIFGTDVSAAAIETARAGRYPFSIDRDVSPERLHRFFTKEEGTYRIRRDVRDPCVFARQNATRDPPFVDVDLISCRNLMIYLESLLQDRILRTFHYALKDSGLLLLGASETARSFLGFTQRDGKSRIYERSAAMPRLAIDLGEARPRSEWRPREVSGSARPSIERDIRREADRLVLDAFAPPGVVIDDNLSIVEFRGRTGAFLEPAAGAPSFDLLRMVRDELRPPLREAIDEARQTRGPTRRQVAFGFLDPSSSRPGPRSVELIVNPFRIATSDQPLFVVLFRETGSPADAATLEPAAAVSARGAESLIAQELASTRHHLQSVIEQMEASNEELRAANEEAVSTNEELRSINEELQMAKEELQATNEELGTVNDEIKARNTEANRLNDDLTNVLNGVGLPIILFDRASRIRQFTPAAATTFHLVASHLGRPVSSIEDIPSELGLREMVVQVQGARSLVERTVQDREGRWHRLTVLPYVTADNRLDGTVAIAVDIDVVKKGALLVAEAQKYAESVVDAVRACLVVVTRGGRIRSANQAFLKTFGLVGKEVAGLHLEDLGEGAWRPSDLRASVQALAEGQMFDGHRVQVDTPEDGRRIFLLSGRPIEKTSVGLLAMEDVTDKEHAAEEVERARKQRDYHEKLRQLAFETAMAEEKERRRIAIDVHDHIGQTLALMQIKMTAIREAVTGPARAKLDELVELLARSIVDTRTLIFDLSPPILYDLGLKEALSWLVEELHRREGLHIAFSDDGLQKPLDDPTASMVFRSVRELLMNVVKHARAARVELSLGRTGDDLLLEVHDDGVGFDAKEPSAGVSPPGFGLFSVREQMSRLGGTVLVDSRTGGGTRIQLRVPLRTG